MGSIIGNISTDVGYTIVEGSNFGTLFVVGGILGCIPFTIWVEKKQAYKIAVTTICVMSTFFCLLEFFVFTTGKAGAVYPIIFFQGAFGFPVLSVAIDFGVELTFPIGESFSSGLINSTGFTFGIIYTILCSQILENYLGDTTGTKICMGILTAVGLVGSIFSIMVK